MYYKNANVSMSFNFSDKFIYKISSILHENLEKNKMFVLSIRCLTDLVTPILYIK